MSWGSFSPPKAALPPSRINRAIPHRQRNLTHHRMSLVVLTVLTRQVPKSLAFELFPQPGSWRGCPSHRQVRILRAREEETPIGKKARLKSGLRRGNTRGTPFPICAAPAARAFPGRTILLGRRVPGGSTVGLGGEWWGGDAQRTRAYLPPPPSWC